MGVKPTQQGRAAFAQALNVSRETMVKFDRWQSLLCKWAGKINLVAPATLDGFWTRHVLDSAQLLRLAPKQTKSWIDLGAGAGFPGLVVALMHQDKKPAENSPPLDVVMVESNAKKAAFLQASIREMGIAARVICARSESLPEQPYDIVSARALAPLPKLLALSAPFCGANSIRLFPKGAGVQKELDAAMQDWTLRYEALPSLTESTASILRIENANHV